MNYVHFFIISFITLIFVGCGGATPTPNSAVSSQSIAQKSVMDILKESNDEELKSTDNVEELYFNDTRGKILYSGNSGNQIDFKTKMLLSTLFHKVKSNLPRKSRREKINISFEVSSNSYKKEELLQAGQHFIISHRRFELANSDSKTMRILKRVLQEEQDGLYSGSNNITSKKRSDIVLFMSASMKKNKLTINAKIIAKNGTILGEKRDISYVNKDANTEWVKVLVPRNDGAPQSYEVMRHAVTLKQYGGSKSSQSITNKSYAEANNFCIKTLKGELITPYVFENARKSFALSRPTSPITTEMIAPYDEEDDAAYCIDGDKLDANDGIIILFHWNSEKYYSSSNLFRSKNTTFRCMRTK